MKYLIILAATFSSFSYSRELTPSQLGLLAEERAPLIRMHIEESRAASTQISQSKLLPNPVLTIQAGSLKAGTEAGSVLDVTINQPTPWFGKRSTEINSAKILEKISNVDLNESKVLINNSVSLMGVELAVLNELEKHNQERKDRFSIIHRFLNSRPLASPSQMVEKNLIETQIMLVENQMFDLETKKKSLEEQLKFLSGESELKVKINWKDVPTPLPLESYADSLENGFGIQRTKHFEDLAQNRIQQASYLARPDLIVGLNYRKENMAPINHFYHANVGIVIPIIDHGQHSVEIARANARREEANKKLALQESSMALRQSYQALISSYKSTRIFRITDLKKVDRQFNLAEDAFKKGRIGVTTFLQTDTQIHESIDLAYMSYIRYYSAMSEISILTGKKLEI